MANQSDAAAERIGGSKPHSPVNAELLDVRAVAALLGGCSVRHIYRLSDAGKLPAPVRLGSLVRWRRSDLDAWIGEGCPPIRSSKGMGR